MKKFLKSCCSGFLYLVLSILLIVGVILAVRFHQTAMLESKCELPCWYGITVGQTQEDEVIEILEQQSHIKYQFETGFTNRYFNEKDNIKFWMYPGLMEYLAPVQGRVIFQENETVFLTISGNIGLNIQQVIKKFGEPEFVYVKPIREWYINGAYIFYPHEGLIIKIGKLFNFHNIESNSKIWSITVIKPEEFQAYIDEGSSFSENIPYGSIFVPWSGYGEVEGKYWFPKGLEE